MKQKKKFKKVVEDNKFYLFICISTIFLISILVIDVIHLFSNTNNFEPLSQGIFLGILFASGFYIIVKSLKDYFKSRKVYLEEIE